MFLQPRHATHKKRSFARSTVVLAEGRPVEAVTQKRRDKLLQAFTDWLALQETTFAELLELTPLSTKRLNGLLVHYGRQLFEAGWPYSHYSEVVNAISSKEPFGAVYSLPGIWPSAGFVKNLTAIMLHFLGKF